jgi:hypothetical protein
MTVDYDTEPTFASRYLLGGDFDAQDRLMEFNVRLAARLSEALALVQVKNERIAELEAAGRDVLPTLESHWRGERPIPAWHPTAALRSVLEEDK